MAYIQLFTDQACTNLWASVPVIEVSPSMIGWGSSPPGDLTLGENIYKYYDTRLPYATALQNVREIHTNPFVSGNRQIEPKTLYCKNGFSLYVGVTASAVYFKTFRWESVSLPFDEQDAGVSESQIPRFWCIGFTDDNGRHYMGFTRVLDPSTWPSYVPPIACIEDSFWTDALRPPYDYSAGTDSDGGQGSGSIPGQTATDSASPSRIIPTGGKGIHTYLIDITAYGDIQSFLWGDNSTLAKSLWQKFLNKTHSPISCVLGCYSLPGVFMPTASGNTGVNLAGMYLSPIGGTCSSVSLGFPDYEFTFSPLDAPFHSFADYTCIACKLHLPIVGDISIPAEFIVNRTISVRYRVDQMNGNTVARVKSGGQVIAELSGNCAYNVPITGGDDGTLDRLGALANTALQLSAGNVAGAMAQSAAGLGAQFQTQIANSSMNGNMTACLNGYPYIEYIYPTTNYPAQYGQVYGYACSVSGVLTNFMGGYGEFEINIDSMEIPGATLIEKEEIRALLKEGIMVC
ncbi:MAG: hypothetical protein J6P66_00660 [Bacteroidaceae bacterium]|nr:hypothetical protein [Bacteroidaceae bacterium]